MLTEENVIRLNKAILASFAILCLLSIPLMMEKNISVKAESKTWYVDDDGPADFSTIQEAVNNATPGDTIYVYNGTYENVKVNKAVSLVGEDRDSTIVDGNGNGSVIFVTAGNVKIHGFTVKGSGIYADDSGILIDKCHGIEIGHNTITDNNDGIHFEMSNGNVISDNIISSNNNDGIHSELSSDTVISDNIISSNNNNGIFLVVSSDLVSGNMITNNDNGINLFMSSDNVISDNIISSNNKGIILGSASGDNTIYHNNFNNIDQVGSESTNVWDYDYEGNYWSDYNGTDLNSGRYHNETGSDGIGDTPYIIDENNKDNYPLAGMFSDFRFTFNQKPYDVNVISNSTISDIRFEIGQETGNKIISFHSTGEGGSIGFCRVMIPIQVLNYSYFVLVGTEEILPTKLNIASETYDYLYFTYIQNSLTISIISSRMLYLYEELLDEYTRLETDLYYLNLSYQELLDNYTYFLNNYSIFLINYSELQKSHQELLGNYTDFLINYGDFLTDYNELQKSHQQLNNSYYGFLKNYSMLMTDYGELQKSHQELLGNYTDFLINYGDFLTDYNELQRSYQELNNSYQELLLDYSKKVDNIQNLTYIFAATTAIFIITTVYLSRSAHAGKAKALKDAKQKRTL